MLVAIGCVVPDPPSEYAPDPVCVRPTGADPVLPVAVTVPPGVVPVGVAEVAGVVVFGGVLLLVVVVLVGVVAVFVGAMAVLAPPGVSCFKYAPFFTVDQ